MSKGAKLAVDQFDPVAELKQRYNIQVDLCDIDELDAAPAIGEALYVLDDLCEAGAVVRDALHSYQLMALQVWPGKHIELPDTNELGYCNSNAFASYEKDKARLAIAADIPASGAMSSELPQVGVGAHNVGKSFQTVLAHELGHCVMENCEQLAGKKFRIVYESQPQSYWEQRVSTYAGKNDRELFAESFAAYTARRYQGNLPPEVVEFLQAAGVCPAVRKARRKPTADKAVSDADWDVLSDAILASLQEVYEEAFKAEALNANADFEDQLVNTEAADYATTRAAELVTQVSKSTRNRLRLVIRDAINNGQTQVTLAKAIVDDFAFSRERASTIARTELAFAASDAHRNVATRAGAVGKRWLLSNDENICDICEANRDQGVIRIDEDFDSGDNVPPAHPNCQCDVEYVYEDDPRADDI